ncbi:MAG: hypothetical protein KTR28_01730 [Micavibrio sp.]|nr:hypothetical protein [Micavibrio sp.]
MKRTFLLLVALLFGLNTFVSVVMAADCGMEMHSTTEAGAEAGDMPCHDMGEQKPAPKESTSHCDGLCLCMHMGVNQIPLAPTVLAYSVSISTADRLEFGQTFYSSQIISPVLRPPIAFS